MILLLLPSGSWDYRPMAIISWLLGRWIWKQKTMPRLPWWLVVVINKGCLHHWANGAMWHLLKLLSHSRRGEREKVQWDSSKVSRFGNQTVWHILLNTYKGDILKWKSSNRGLPNQMFNVGSPVMGQCDVCSLTIDSLKTQHLFRTALKVATLLYIQSE